MRGRRPRAQRGPRGRPEGGDLERLRLRRPQRRDRDGPRGGPVARRVPGWRGRVHGLSTRLYGPRPANRGLSFLGDQRVAVSGVPTAAALEDLLQAGITHAVNCRAPLQTALSQDVWALRAVLGPDRVALAPMWDHGRAQPPALWAPAARFAAEALDDPAARVLVHCQQGRRRSVLVAYAVLRLRGMAAEEAAGLIAASRGVAHLVPAYRDSVEGWLAGTGGAGGAPR